MALSEVFPPTRSEIMPAKRAARALIPITARELVEWTYAEQKPHMGGEMMIGNAGGISQTGIVVERLLLGCTVDTSGGGSGLWGSVYCDDDALTVHGIVETLPGWMRGLLIECGEQRSAPNWQPMIMPLRCVPVPGSKGRPKGIYMRNSNNLIGNLVTYEGDWPDRETASAALAAWPDAPRLRCADELIERARKTYQDWHKALRALCDRLEAAGRRGLRRYRIAGLGAACEPWHDNNLSASRNAA